MLAASIGALFSASFLGSTAQSAWALLNQYQLILILPYLKSYLTKEFKFFIRDFKFALFDFDFLNIIPIPYLTKDTNTLHYPQPDEIFAENDLESGSFIVNQLDLFKMIFIIGVIHSVFMVLRKMIPCTDSPKLLAISNKLLDTFQFAIYFRIIIEAYVFSFLAAFSEVYRVDTATEHMISYLLAFFFMLLLLAFPFSIMLYYFIRSKKGPHHKLINEVFKDIKHSHVCKMYHVGK